MKRLLDLPASDHLTERAHILIRATGRTVESEARLLRVRRALDLPKLQARNWALRFALIVGLLGASAVAAAASGVLGGVFDEVKPSASPAGVSPVVAAPRAVVPGPAARGPIPEAASESPPSPAAPAAVLSPPSARSATSDVARVHEAAKALRHDRDPARALQLLERSGTPIVGPLAEEALALRIEASMALGGGREKRLAAAYLAQYPAGRYRELAKRALAASDR